MVEAVIEAGLTRHDALRRQVEWYFHEQAAADAARRLFEDDDKLDRIKIFVRPYPGGVPKYNPRINLLDEYNDYEGFE